MRSPRFEAMIGRARLYPQLWLLLLGLVIVIFSYLGTVAMGMVALFMALGPFEFGAMLRQMQQPTEPGAVILLLFSFFGLLVGPMLAAAACQRRGPGNLFGPMRATFGGFLATLAIAVPAYALFTWAGEYLQPSVPNLPTGVWLSWLPWALPLLLVQVTAEELLFRGYLQSQLAARFRSPLVWMALPTALWTGLHYDPSAGPEIWFMLATTFVFGLIAADLTVRTGSLGAAIGLHFVNNVFALLVVALNGSLTGLARWTTAFTAQDLAPTVTSLGLSVAFMAVVWRILRLVLDR